LLPRIVRVGDSFESGVVVSAPDAGAEPLTVTVTATVVPPPAPTLAHRRLRQAADGAATAAQPAAAVELSPENPFSRTATLSAAKQQQEVRFKFTAARLGSARLRFDVRVGGGAAASDSANYEVDVLGRQGSVFLATSLALQAGANGTGAGQVEGLALPEAEPGSGSVDLVAGVGNLPFLKVRAGAALPGCRCWACGAPPVAQLLGGCIGARHKRPWHQSDPSQSFQSHLVCLAPLVCVWRRRDVEALSWPPALRPAADSPLPCRRSPLALFPPSSDHVCVPSGAAGTGPPSQPLRT
jgi:hypothetical protein